MLTEQRGQELANTLRGVPPGRTASTSFEDACIGALQYLPLRRVMPQEVV